MPGSALASRPVARHAARLPAIGGACRPRRPALAVAVLVTLLIGLAVVPPGDAAAGRRPRPRHELKIATLAPDGSTWMKIMRAMDEAIREATENRVGIKFYPGGVQGDEFIVLRKIGLGQVQGGGFTGQGLGAIAPELRVLEVPFLFDNYDEVDRVRQELDPVFEGILADKGYALLGWADVGFVYLFTNRPVTTPDDLRDVKMWLWEGDPLATAFYEAFDISPIPLALTDVLTALQTGLVDGVYGTPLSCVALQWFTRIGYMTHFPLVYGTGAMVVDRRAWEKIPEADRAIVREVADRHFAELIAATRQGDREAIETMRERGIEILEIDAAEARDFVETGRAVRYEQAGTLYPRALLDRVEAVLAEMRAASGD
ncbi:MAG: TRAP transporter substrate-binding protein DctP [Candidatus Eiseniibacteriota bacterium]|jgi:TRAP-type C4-dicarboxylate transport system substrate-binding protein